MRGDRAYATAAIVEEDDRKESELQEADSKQQPRIRVDNSVELLLKGAHRKAT